MTHSMEQTFRRIVIYLAMALISMAVFNFVQPRKVITSRQTKEAISANEEKTNELKWQQELIVKRQLELLANQDQLIKELLIQRKCQEELVENQRKVIKSMGIKP